LRSVELFERLPSWSGPSYTINGSLGIWAEQGIGDQVLFSTMLPELIATGQQFVYEVDSRLLPAYKRAFPKANFVAFNDPPAAVLQSANAALFAGSLPRFFSAVCRQFFSATAPGASGIAGARRTLPRTPGSRL